jgi:hypothetical protein
VDESGIRDRPSPDTVDVHGLPWTTSQGLLIAEARPLGIDAADFGFASRVAWWIGYSVSTLVLGLLLLLLAPALDPAIVRVMRERMGGAIGFGVAVFFLPPVMAVLFLVVIVAIPLGLFLMLALALALTRSAGGS